LFFLTALMSLSWATTPEEVVSAWAVFNAGAELPLPKMTEPQLDRLLEGKLVKYREVGAEDEPQRVVGMQIVPMDRSRIWAAARAEDVDYDGAIFWAVAGAPEGRERWYEWIDIPFPFADRHFVLDVWDNDALAKSSDNRVWEHPWAIAKGVLPQTQEAAARGEIEGVSPAVYRKSVEVNINNGAWVAIALSPDETLLVFHAQSVVGGAIPDKLIADFVMMSMGKVFKGLTARASNCEEWFKPGKLVGPGGELVTLRETQ